MTGCSVIIIDIGLKILRGYVVDIDLRRTFDHTDKSADSGTDTDNRYEDKAYKKYPKDRKTDFFPGSFGTRIELLLFLLDMPYLL